MAGNNGATRKPDPIRHCPVCGVLMERKRYNGRLEDRTRFLSRETCGKACGGTKEQVTKDALHWRARKHRKSNCQECNTTTGLHVHHIDRNPANNDPTNLMTLCSTCHIKLHWREDREKRLAAAAQAYATAVVRGVFMRPRSTVGRES